MRFLPFVPLVLLASCAKQETAPKPSMIVFEASRPTPPASVRDQVAQAAPAVKKAPAPTAPTPSVAPQIAAAPAQPAPKKHWFTGKPIEPKTEAPQPQPQSAAVAKALAKQSPAPAAPAAPQIATAPAQPAPKKHWFTGKPIEPKTETPQPQPAAVTKTPIKQAPASTAQSGDPKPLANPPKARIDPKTGQIIIEETPASAGKKSSAVAQQTPPAPEEPKRHWWSSKPKEPKPQPQAVAEQPKPKRHWWGGKIEEPQPQPAIAQQPAAQPAPAKTTKPQEIDFQDHTPLPPIPQGSPRSRPSAPPQPGDALRDTMDKQGLPEDKDLRSSGVRPTPKSGSGDVIAKPPKD